MMKSTLTKYFIAVLIFIVNQGILAQELYIIPENTQTRWFSFENQNAEKGNGGKENYGAKGHPSDKIPAGNTVVLMETEGAGTIRRIWLTINDRSPEMLRSLKIEMFWDGAEVPAVSSPLGDFFGIGLGRKVPFENVFFSDPEGRSFNCIIPMPFKNGAKITLTNESEKDLNALFYDVDITITPEHKKDVLYFHTYWNRDTSTILQEDYQILPKTIGKGRFLGVNIGLITHPDYRNTWWGEGEIKMYIDGDAEFPTLVGTGTEDYVGSAYGQGEYAHMYQGSLIIDDKKGEYAFYRYHLPDPVFFYNDIKVAIQQLGGAPNEIFLEMQKEGAKLIPVTITSEKGLIKLLEEKTNLDGRKGWTNFYRSDDICSTAYFYLDTPEGQFPELPPLEIRLKQ